MHILRRTILIGLPFVLLTAGAPKLRAQLSDGRLAVLLRGTVTTTSKLYLSPDAPTADARSQYDSYNTLLGAGAEFRLMLAEEQFYLAVSSEYNATMHDQIRPIAFVDSVRLLPVQEGVRFIPIELGAYAYIPLGSDVVRMTMGGGIGAYIGVRELTVGTVGTKTLNTPVGFGIHVGIGMEYRLTSSIAMQGALRFRDPEIRTENSFDQTSIPVGSRTRTLSSATIASKVVVDGMNFSLGVLLRIR